MAKMAPSLSMWPSMHELWCLFLKVGSPKSNRSASTTSELIALGVSPMLGAIATDAVVTGFHAVFRRGEIRKEDVAFLFGLGGLGFNALQMMLSLGIRVIVSDVKEDMLQAAALQGVRPEDIVPLDKSPQEFLKENGLEGKIDVVLDFVGVKQTFSDAQVLGQSIFLFPLLNP